MEITKINADVKEIIPSVTTNMIKVANGIYLRILSKIYMFNTPVGFLIGFYLCYHMTKGLGIGIFVLCDMIH